MGRIFGRSPESKRRLQPGDHGWEPSQEDVEIARQKRVGEDGRQLDPIHPDAERFHQGQRQIAEDEGTSGSENVTEAQRRASFWGPSTMAGGLALRHGEAFNPPHQPKHR